MCTKLNALPVKCANEQYADVVKPLYIPQEISSDDLQRANALCENIQIPPRPKVVIEINREMLKPEPDIRLIARMVREDPALTSKVLRLINSPIYALRREILSLDHAIAMLGLKVFNQCIVTASLRQALMVQHQDPLKLEQFWTCSLAVGQIAEYLANRMPGLSELLPPEQAYLGGLFHDCAIPLFLRRFPDYLETLAHAKKTFQPIFAFEEEQFSANHGAIGYLMAKSWGLPMPVCQAIRYHHHSSLECSEIGEHPGLEVLPVFEVLRIADYLADVLMESKGFDVAPCYRDEEEFLSTVSITPSRLDSLKDEIFQLLGKTINKE